VKFRRRSKVEPVEGEESVDSPADLVDEASAERPRGPWDRAETSADKDDKAYIDLGGLVVKGAPGTELRLQVDEKTQAVAAVMMAGEQSGLELRAFAAPRRGGIWDDVRRDIAAEASKRGGTATEVDGEFGTELKLVVPVRTADGRQGTQTTRVVGVEGPRWLLRGTFLGKSAVEPDPDGVIESAFRDVIVVRGDAAMAPRELIPMHVPNQAQGATAEADPEPIDPIAGDE
jgi:hypothetical protein